MRSSGLSVNVRLPRFQHGDHDLALVVRVDQPDQVAEHDAVLVAQPRARQDHRRQPGIGEVDGDAGRDQRRLAGRDVERRVDAGAQVQAGGTRRGVVRRAVAQALVEDLDVDACASVVSCAAVRATCVRRAGAPVRSFGAGASGWRACVVEQHQPLSSPPKPSWMRLPTISGIFLRRRLACGVFLQVLGFRRRSRRRTAHPAARRPRPGCPGSATSSMRRHAAASFLIFCAAALADR